MLTLIVLAQSDPVSGSINTVSGYVTGAIAVGVAVLLYCLGKPIINEVIGGDENWYHGVFQDGDGLDDGDRYQYKEMYDEDDLH